MFTGALLDPSTQTIRGTWLPPKDCFRMIWIWAAPFGRGVTCRTVISIPDTVTRSRGEFAVIEGSSPVTWTLRISPAAEESPAREKLEKLVSALIAGGGASICTVTGKAACVPLLNRRVAGPVGKLGGTRKLTWVEVADCTCTGTSL